jgi:hypothetical protein
VGIEVTQLSDASLGELLKSVNTERSHRNDVRLVAKLRELVADVIEDGESPEISSDNPPVRLDLSAMWFDNGWFFQDNGTLTLKDGTILPEIEYFDLSELPGLITELSSQNQPMGADTQARIDLVKGTIEVNEYGFRD